MSCCLARCRFAAPNSSRSIITTSSLTRISAKVPYDSKIRNHTPSPIKIHPAIAGPPQKDTMAAVSQTLLARCDPSGERRTMISRKDPKSLRPGQVLSIYAYNNYPALTPISVFSGYLIGIKRSGVESSIRLRSRVMRVGTEMRFPVFSPTIKEIKVIKETPPKKIRRAKLFYMRTEKHDKGAVDAIVKADRERKETTERTPKKNGKK